MQAVAVIVSMTVMKNTMKNLQQNNKIITNVCIFKHYCEMSWTTLYLDRIDFNAESWQARYTTHTIAPCALVVTGSQIGIQIAIISFAMSPLLTAGLQ